MACGGGETAPGGPGGGAGCDACETPAWAHSFGGPEAGATGKGVAATQAGEIWVAGVAVGEIDVAGQKLLGPEGGIFAARLDADGEPLFRAGYPDSDPELNNGARAVEAAPDGGMYLVADAVRPWTLGSEVTVEGQVILVARLGPGGEVLWKRQFGQDVTRAFATHPDGGVVVGGVTKGTTDFGAGPVETPRESPFVVKLDENGAHVWDQVLRMDEGSGYAWAVGVDGGGMTYVSGDLSSGGSVGSLTFAGTTISGEPYMAVLGPDGAPRAMTALPEPIVFVDLVGLPDGGAIAVGRYTGPADLAGPLPYAEGDESNIVAARFDADARPVWALGLGGTGMADADGVALGPDGRVHLCGEFRGALGDGGRTLTAEESGSDIFYAALDPATGAVERLRAWSGEGKNRCEGIDVDGAGNVLLTGTHYGVDFGTGLLTPKGSGSLAARSLGDAFVVKLVPALLE